MKRALALISLACSWPLTVTGTNLYVAIGGNDADDCLTPATACATLQAAVNDRAAPAGDIVHVGAGTFDGNITIAKSVEIYGAGLAQTIVSGPNGSVFVIEAGTNVVLAELTIEDGETTDKGAGIDNAGELLLRDAMVKDCWAYFNPNMGAGFGGGIYNSGSLTIERSTVFRNHSEWLDGTGLGGGIYNSSTGSLIMVDSMLDQNWGGYAPWSRGGAIYNGGSARIVRTLVVRTLPTQTDGTIWNTGTLDLINSTVTWNGSHGGIVAMSGGTVRVASSTITDNHGPDLRAYSNSELSVRNTLVSDGDGNLCQGELQSHGYNLLAELDLDCTLVGDLTGNLIGVAPRLETHDWPGPTAPLALRVGSPAIDAGDPAGCVDPNLGPIITDHRGVDRHLPLVCGEPGRCDIGAYELDGCAEVGTVYQSIDPQAIVTPGNEVGAATSNPFDHAPPGADLLYYQLDGGPVATLHLTRGGSGLLIHF